MPESVMSECKCVFAGMHIMTVHWPGSQDWLHIPDSKGHSEAEPVFAMCMENGAIPQSQSKAMGVLFKEKDETSPALHCKP